MPSYEFITKLKQRLQSALRSVFAIPAILFLTTGAAFTADAQAPGDGLFNQQLLLNQNEKISVETERKFLVDPKLIPKKYFDLAEIYEIKQTYISKEPEIRIRQVISNIGTYFLFGLKMPRDNIGLSRTELEFEISENVYNDLLKKGIGNTIHKTRLQFDLEGIEISVDIYHTNSLSGLSVTEVEFKSVEDSEKFNPPDWFGKDVTTDKRYKNINLSIKGKPQ